MSENDYILKAKEYLFLSENTKEPTLSTHYYTMYIETLFKGDLSADKNEKTIQELNKDKIPDNKSFGRHKNE
jgi:hypothetical protein